MIANSTKEFSLHLLQNIPSGIGEKVDFIAFANFSNGDHLGLTSVGDKGPVVQN